MKKWALVLSGGGGKGMVHVGIIKGLIAAGLKPDLIAGTSIGAVIGCMLACGLSPEEIEETARQFDIRKYLDGFFIKLHSRNPVTRFLQAEEALGSVLRNRGFDEGHHIREYLEKLYGGRQFGETDIPFYCNTVDLCTGEEKIMSEGPLSIGVYASMAYPGVFAPLESGSALYSDGAILHNIPVHIARKHGIGRVLTVNLGLFRPMEKDSIGNALSVVYRSYAISRKAQEIKRNDRPTLQFNINTKTATFDFSNRELIDKGEDVVGKHLNKIRRILKSPVIWGTTEIDYE